MPARRSWVGERYGRLTVIGEPERPSRCIKLRCDCGVVFFGSTSNLATGNTQSCGCLKRERVVARHTRHGMSRTSIYMSWSDMIGRCTRPSHPRWGDYGGRGITVCERWRDFANFYADMGDRPPGLTLDRIDNDRGYEPGNCRWTTNRQQARNKRPSHLKQVRDQYGRFAPKEM